MYNFDMTALLAEFDNDPEQLAAAFTTQLNKTLDDIHKKEEIKKKANAVAAAWNDFVFSYCETKGIKDTSNFIFKDGFEVMDTFDLIARAFPEVEKYLSLAEKISPTIEHTIDNFQNTMKDFFKKYNIE